MQQPFFLIYKFGEFVMDIGSAVKRCRTLKQLTQAELAKRANISVSHLCLLEQNKREPSVSSLDSISKALNMPLSVLMLIASEGDDISEISSENVNKLSDVIYELISDVKEQ